MKNPRTGWVLQMSCSHSVAHLTPISPNLKQDFKNRRGREGKQECLSWWSYYQDIWGWYCIDKFRLKKFMYFKIPGAPGWLSWLSVQLRLRSWSHGLWVRALQQALCWQLRTWSLLQILSPSLSAPPPLALSLSLSLSLSKIIKNI